MRRTQWATMASAVAGSLLVLGIAACSDSTNPSSSSTPLTATEANDIGAAEADEVDQSVDALTLDGLTSGGAVQSAASLLVLHRGPIGSGCATVDNTTDSDDDGAPDAATLTFALPACSFTNFRGGTLELTGEIVLSDPTPTSADFALQAELNDLQFKYTNPDATRTYTAVRNGTRTLSGSAAGASLSNTITTVRSRPGHPDATISHNLLLTFTPAEGQHLALGQLLPDGTFTKSGTLIWSRAGVSRTFTVTTVDPLVWDASCVTDRKIASGEIRATLPDGSYIKTVWTACGVDPTRTFVPAS
jgi:hypothetical protein